MTPVMAHKPTLDGPFSNLDNAFVIEDSTISIVVYQEITCDNNQLWMQFDVDAEAELYIQLGVPVIDRLAGYRPQLAVLAKGLPEANDLPFTPPSGLGAQIFHSSEESSDFYEPFTQTESWFYIEETIVIPQSGTGYNCVKANLALGAKQ